MDESNTSASGPCDSYPVSPIVSKFRSKLYLSLRQGKYVGRFLKIPHPLRFVHFQILLSSQATGNGAESWTKRNDVSHKTDTNIIPKETKSLVRDESEHGFLGDLRADFCQRFKIHDFLKISSRTKKVWEIVPRERLAIHLSWDFSRPPSGVHVPCLRLPVIPCSFLDALSQAPDPFAIKKVHRITISVGFNGHQTCTRNA
jgi:hypothetical protein